MSDDIAGADARLGCRRIVDRRQDLDEPVLHRDFDAQPAELAAGLYLHIFEALDVHVARMRIEPIEHAVDCRFDQLAFVRLLHVMRAHPFEDIAEQIELAVGVGLRRPCTRADQQPG